MAVDLTVSVGPTQLKNPVIAGSGEHLIAEGGIRAALRAGVGAVVVKSTNEVAAAKDQLDRAEYVLLDARWRPVPWDVTAPRSATVACRSGLHPLPFDRWLEQTAKLDQDAQKEDSFVVASLILGDLAHAVMMARKVQAAGVRILEFNVGTPYASQAVKGAVATELVPEQLKTQVAALRAAVSLPIWVKVTGQSERVPDLARAAFEAGAQSCVMAGRLLGLIPDLETLDPLLGTSLGVGGAWNLPVTCHWLAASRAALGRDRPLIGTNGAQDGRDVARFMLAGATAAQIASPVMIRGFGLLAEAIAELTRFLEAKGLDARDLVGLSADRKRTFADMPPQPGNWKAYVPPESRES